MTSRLWTNPPTKADGTLDYARLTVHEVLEDLTETLMDLVENGGQQALAVHLNALSELDLADVSDVPSVKLVTAMEALLTHETSDADFRSSEARQVVASAVRELQAIRSDV